MTRPLEGLNVLDFSQYPAGLYTGLPRLFGGLIGCNSLVPFAEDRGDPFRHRDVIKRILQERLRTQTTAHWLTLLEASDYGCASVFRYKQLLNHDGYRVLGMDRVVRRSNRTEVRTLRCPIRVDGQPLYSTTAAPVLGNANEFIDKGF